jgi:hypothetical protein
MANVKNSGIKYRNGSIMVAENMGKNRKYRNIQKIQNRKFVLKNEKLAQTIAREPFFKFVCSALSLR